MAQLHPCFYILPLLLHACCTKWTGERRFSDTKRCADDECSMLLGRGKAAKDFTGPDCRFLSFKKGETIYVYYKLSGQRSDVWAGSVGNHFGYFPKDYLTVNHIYTEKEIEVPAEETDFVCFDTGLDKFDSYDIDALLGNSLLIENENLTEDSKEPLHNEADVSQMPSETETESSESAAHVKTETSDSESLLETETENSDSLLETETENSESAAHLKTETSDSDSLLETETKSSESAAHVKTETSDSLLETETENSDSLLETENSDSLLETETSDSDSLLETETVDSESAAHLKTETSDSDSLLETETENSESPVKDALLSIDEESDSFQPKTDISLKTILESKDELEKKDPDPTSVQVPEKTADISLNDDAVAIEDAEMEQSDVQNINHFELNNQHDFEKQFDSEDSEHQQIMETEAHTADVDDKETAKTEKETPLQTTEKETPLQTTEKILEMVEEDKNLRSTFKDVFEAEQTDETEFPEETTKDMEELPEESHLAHHENLLTERDSEEQATAENNTDGKLLEPSQDTKTPDATGDSDDIQPKSHDITSKPPETVLPTINADSMLTDDGDEKEDPQKVNKIETANENAADLQKVNMNTNEKAGNNVEDSSPQDTVTTEDYNAEEVDPKTSEEAAVLESSETTATVDKPDDQINKVKNELAELLKHTLESERQSTEDEEEPQDQDEKEDDEELLEDENALLSYESHLTEDTHEPEVNLQPELQIESDASDDNSTEADDLPSSPLINTTQEEDKKESEHKHDVPVLSEDPVYSDSVLRLTILRDHLKDEDMERIQKYLGLKNLFKLEAMFSDLEQEMFSVRMSQTSTEDIENTLDQIMEASENSILDETEEMLNERERRAQEHGQKKEPEMYDMEASILDSFQEIVFSLRQKFSAASDSTPLMEEEQPVHETDKLYDSDVVKDLDNDVETVKLPESPEIQEEHNESELILNSEKNVNAQDLSHSQDMGLEEDGGHFNRNKDAQIGFEDTEEIQKGPHAILEKSVDIGFHFEVDQSSGSLETPSVSDFHDTETNADVPSPSISDELWSLLLLAKEYLGVYAEVIIAALPEEWRPGPTFHGVPWEPVLVTAAVGFLTVLMFFWRTVLAIKGRSYQLTEKQLRQKIQQLLSEKSDAVNKISELNDVIKEREEQLKNSKETITSSQQDMKQLKKHHQKLQSQCEEMSGSISQFNQKIMDTQEENSNLNEKIVKMHQRIEKYQKTLKNFDEERAKVHVLMDEAKFREDALKAQMNCFEKENSALKEQKKSLLRDAKDWQEKHEKLNEEIRVYHKSQKELEDSLMHKENEIDVLSGCIAELTRLGACDAADVQKDDAKMSHGEEADKKIDSMRLRIKQMMDVSRIKATLSVIEEERNRYMESLFTEQKSRQELEERYQKVMHDQMNLKNEKTHLENQFKNLQQRLEITTELYQQKENALQQKLTQEELERREKETKLSEVDSKAVRSEEELRALKQKIRDIEEEMQQNEQTLKNEVAVQEKKAHENWLKARASERALVEERREAVTLRQKLVECSDKISDMEQTLFKLNTAPPDRHMRRGDSYGPSPVSGGAPSPPLMIEGPGRPPSAPVGRRSDSFGPRPTSDNHGRFSDLGHPLPARPEMFPPMTSSPCAHDGPMLSKSQSQGSFLPSPIRDSPVLPHKSYGPPHMGGPVPLNGPPPLMIRPPNGHPPMMPPGPPLGPDPRFRPPPIDSYGPPIGPFGPVPPPFARGPPLRDLPPMGPLPPHPLGPRDVPPEFYGPRGLPPRPFSTGPLPPPGAMAPPPYGSRGFSGPAPPMARSSRDGEENITPANNPPTDGPPQQGAAQDTEP